MTKNNWLWIVLTVYIIHGRFSQFDANFLTGFMISLFLAAPALRVRRASNLMGTSVRDGLRFFLLFGKKYYFIEKLTFLIDNLFRNVFQTPMLREYFNFWKEYFLAWHFIENQVFIISALFPYFSITKRLFKLMQLVWSGNIFVV